MHGVRNGVKTAALLGLVGTALVVAGGLVAGRTGLAVGALLALALGGYSYYRADQVALRALAARPVGEVEQPALYRIVRELATAAGQPMPRLYLSSAPQPNAFATGRSPRHAVVCATGSLLDTLDERQLRAVLGHELSHVYHRDTLVASVAGALATGITLLASLAFLFHDTDDDERNPLAALLMIVLGPAAAGLLYVVVSRSREYRADEAGALLTNDPRALASALATLDAATSAAPLPATPRLLTCGHLMTANPFGGVARRLATHPPMGERIARLHALAASDPRFDRP